MRRPGAETAPSLQQLFSQPYVGLVDVDIVIASNAQRLGEEYTLKPPDAIHLATAIQHICYELLAWDDDFIRRVNRTPIPGLRVGEPY